MTQINSSNRDDPEGGVTVRAPRVTDAIGKTLRRAFGTSDRFPPDWLRALAQLDRAR